MIIADGLQSVTVIFGPVAYNLIHGNAAGRWVAQPLRRRKRTFGDTAKAVCCFEADGMTAPDELKTAPTDPVAIPGHADVPESTSLRNRLIPAFPSGSTSVILWLARL